MDIQRQRDWQRRLPRLRLDAEPVPVQVERYRRTTLALMAVPGLIGLLFLGIFTAFGRPDVGAVVVGVLVVPIMALAWFDFARLRAGARAYLRERGDDTPPG